MCATFPTTKSTSRWAASPWSAQDRYSLKVPAVLAFAEFRGYDTWQTVAISQNGDKIETILGNPEMIEAYKAGIPGTASLSPMPPGRRRSIGPRPGMLRWSPGDPTVLGPLDGIDFMVKDSKRFADSGGWQMTF